MTFPIKDTQREVDEFVSELSCRVKKPYPSGKVKIKNKHVADLLLNAFANGGNAELTAVAQYINHHLTISQKDVSNLELCIALVEMKHLEMVGDLIESLGGNPKYLRTNRQYWTGGNVDYGKTLCQKLSLDIYAETEAIAGYRELLRQIKIPQVRKVINRIIEDEMLHRKLFQAAYKKHCK
ncbi:MAG TPA: ferritin family protein [Syntrophomonadaceae bacterium]|nr:ferritin family protein [Syntrophomonadaceae bacterium]